MSTLGEEEKGRSDAEGGGEGEPEAGAATETGVYGNVLIIREPPKYQTTEQLHAGKIYKVRTTLTHDQREYTSAPTDYVTEADHLHGGAQSDFKSVAGVKSGYVKRRGEEKARMGELLPEGLR